ncbi:MAG TPA: MFS transporter [Rhizomicrobium sp.]|nr:MFS transporter [Rhizomicrobium sp.]
MTNIIDIKAFIDDRPIAPFLWVLVAMCFLVVVADGMDVAIMGFVTPSILQDWNISRPAFGLVISAAPFGLVIGALIAGPSSDRFGRKIVLTISVLLFGIFMFMAAWSSSPQEMALLRLLAGMGMGAAMPNATTLLSEYVPQRRLSLLITIMFSGFSLGSAAIGFIAGYMIPHFGWRSVLLVGGITPLVLVPFLLALLPESARYLALQGAPADKIAKVLGRVTGHRFTGGESFVSPEPSPLRARSPIGVLFSDGYARTTIALWITYFMGLMVVYLLTGWLPTLMKDAGLTITAAANVTAMFQIGSMIGAILIGWGMDRGHPSRVIGAAYLAGAVFIMGLAWLGALSGWLPALVFAAGFCFGAQTGLNAFAPGCYPTMARATGVSWMLGMGRFGSIVGSLAGGALLGLGWSFGAVLGILAIPALCAAIAIASTRPIAGSFPLEAAAH